MDKRHKRGGMTQKNLFKCEICAFVTDWDGINNGIIACTVYTYSSRTGLPSTSAMDGNNNIAMSVTRKMFNPHTISVVRI